MVKVRKITSIEAKGVSKIIVEELKDWIPYIKTITPDNGKEFTDHKFVSE